MSQQLSISSRLVAFAAAVTFCALGGLACGPDTAPEASDTRVTWYRDALPIVQSRCQSCHMEGSVSGLDLTKYETARDHASIISSYVQARIMPPWLPDESCQANRNARRLSDDEIQKLVAWVDGGAVEGDPKDAPPPFVPQAGLSRYDVELDTGLDYTPDGSRTDDYRCFIVDDTTRGGDRQITGFEVVPDQTALLHHVLLYKASRSEAQALDDAAPGPGWPCFGGPKTNVAIALGAWAPGGIPTTYPGGTGVALYSDEVVILQFHFNMLASPPKPDRTKLRLQYATRPVTNALLLPMVNRKFQIPPHSTGFTAEDIDDVPVDSTIWGLAPHMHKLGKHIKVEGPNTCLVDIPQWDFSWQQFYFFEQKGGVPLKTGDQLKLTCEWDNPTDATVTWGENTTDEMCLAFVYVTPQ